MGKKKALGVHLREDRIWALFSRHDDHSVGFLDSKFAAALHEDMLMSFAPCRGTPFCPVTLAMPILRGRHQIGRENKWMRAFILNSLHHNSGLGFWAYPRCTTFNAVRPAKTYY